MSFDECPSPEAAIERLKQHALGPHEKPSKFDARDRAALTVLLDHVKDQADEIASRRKAMDALVKDAGAIAEIRTVIEKWRGYVGPETAVHASRALDSHAFAQIVAILERS